MVEDSKYILEPLREVEDFTLYRGRERDNQMPILAVAVAAEQPSPQSLRRLEHEFSLATELGAAWAAQPRMLTHHRGRALLILEDPGGEPLDQLIEQDKGRATDLTHFLRIAIGLAAALSQAHQQGLIHKDVKPANALVDSSGHVWLTGFGIASRLPRERPAPAPPEIIAGTLAYMSPEQTGRMNRSVDSRSDLYSLGVTLYQMLTGVLPFAAADPLEWVHCHIARQPVVPIDRREVPKSLSDLIMKLLAKNAEERYQTAAGLKADLRRCQSEWQSHGRIDQFALGADDLSDRLLIPEKLYGREREVDALLAAFDRVVTRGAPELVLVSGYSGVGKTSVVNELHKSLVPPRGLFAAGKFDRYRRDVPYATLAQAFQSLIRQILSKREMELRDWREALAEAVGANGLLIVDLIPELELVIGKQPPVADLSPQDAQRRFQAVLRRFIGVFARPHHPLALFLDDLQWVDAATLDLLEDLLTQGDTGHLLLIGAYRDNEVEAAHPLLRKLGAIRLAGATVHDFVLTPLSDDDLGQLIGDALHCEPDRARPLTQLVQEKTGGNPFFAIHFLHTLEDEALLVFNHADARWSWNLGRIRAKHSTDNLVDLMVANLNRLPSETSAVLCQLACVGSAATFALLATVCQMSSENLHACLWEALRAGLVLRSEDAYAFRHDRIQEAAYSLIPDDARAEVHLRIGRLLLTHTSPEARDGIIFKIVDQFNRSTASVISPDEREQVAQLNLIAGKRAKNAAAYAAALSYLADGRALLAKDCWTLQYQLVFELELHRAECEFLTGALASAEERLSMLANHAANLVDQAAVTCLRVDLYIILVRPERAVDVGLEYLQRVGFEVSPDPKDWEVRQEYERIWQQLGTRRIEDLIGLPLMNDPGRRATIDVLNKLVVSALYLDPKLHQLLLAHMVNFSMAHGNSAASCVGYASLGRVLATEFDDYAPALRFGQLSLDLVDKQGLDTFRARVYFTFGTGISPWVQHLRLGLAFLSRASDEAKKIGDLPYIGFCHSNIVGNLISAGERLLDVDRAAIEGLDFAQKTGSGLVVAYILGQLRLIRSLTGLACDFKSFDNEEFDAEKFEQRLSADSNLAVAAGIYWSRRLQALVFEEDYASALEVATRAASILRTPNPNIERAEYHFYAALARAGSVGAVDSARTEEEIAHLEALRAHHRQLQVWAETCPENFESRAALLGAELARLEGRELEAERLYAQAIRSARVNNFIHIEALTCETAARFYAIRGFDEIAEMYLVRARDGYRRWGADSKVRRLDARHPGLARADGHNGRRAVPDEQFDVAAVVKASQALSGEMLLPRLIERLMTIALQTAGADRGLLILPNQNVYHIEAETLADGNSVVLHSNAADNAAVPETIIRYATRTQARVILDDAAMPNLFSEDPYLSIRQPRSVFCLPLVRQGMLGGLLYLENSLAPHVFTPERARLLELLASQAAISLENANLYSDLQLQAGLLQRLPVSAWTLKPDGTPDFVNQVWLEYSGQTLDFIRSHPEAWMTAVHPEDREIAAKNFWKGVHSGQGFTMETRSLRAQDGTYRWHLQQAVVLRDAEGKILRFVGTTTDIDDQKRTEEALRQAQGDLARINRVTTMGELAASLAHEVSQPISGAMTNANVCLRKLGSDQPDLDEVRTAVTRIVRDAKRAAEILGRIRSQFQKSSPKQEILDVNEILREMIGLLRDEAVRYNVSVQTELATDLPQIVGDRVQLLQVAMNLFVNCIDAMKDVDGTREMVIQSRRADSEQILVSVSDTGIGLPVQHAEQIFDPFFTTKPHGTGMGLRISRSIIESHGGRLWAVPNDGPGAKFSFSIPAETRE
jgi:PAS domain S-box-containing protein